VRQLHPADHGGTLSHRARAVIAARGVPNGGVRVYGEEVRPAAALLATLLLAMATSGCTYVYRDGDGVLTMIGLGYARAPLEREAANLLAVTSLGLAIVSTDLGTAVSLGYSEDRFGRLGSSAAPGISQTSRATSVSAGGASIGDETP